MPIAYKTGYIIQFKIFKTFIVAILQLHFFRLDFYSLYWNIQKK